MKLGTEQTGENRSSTVTTAIYATSLATTKHCAPTARVLLSLRTTTVRLLDTKQASPYGGYTFQRTTSTALTFGCAYDCIQQQQSRCLIIYL